MATYPTYDPTPLADGISTPEWDWLNDEANHLPLLNRAIQGQWASGSTFKLFTGYAALESGLMAPDTPFSDSGAYHIPGCGNHPKCTRINAGGAAHGRITISQALTVSSDVFFYNIGAQFWLHGDQFGGEEAMQQYIAPWGIGQKTGIPLANESAGRLPTPQWLREYCTRVACEAGADEWRAGDSVNLAVGQGSLTLTPLQLANGYATFANGGRRYQPQIAIRIEPPGDAAAINVDPVVAGEVDLPAEIREPMLDGFIGVTQRGTAARAFAGFDNQNWPVAGKTGTAQVDNKADTALFAAFGPAYDPHYAISVIMEESGFGGSNAAPVARALFDAVSGAVPLQPAPPGGVFSDEGGLTEAGGAYD
jgi:penicillin-binding protein 2